MIYCECTASLVCATFVCATIWPHCIPTYSRLKYTSCGNIYTFAYEDLSTPGKDVNAIVFIDMVSNLLIGLCCRNKFYKCINFISVCSPRLYYQQISLIKKG